MNIKWFKRKDEWWRPYRSAEEAYDLDWTDAIFEYVRRAIDSNELSNLEGWPWDDSKWANKNPYYWTEPKKNW